MTQTEGEILHQLNEALVAVEKAFDRAEEEWGAADQRTGHIYHARCVLERAANRVQSGPL